MEILADIAETVDTADMTGKGQAMALLHAYLEAQSCHLDDGDTEGWEIIANDNGPFVRQGLLHVHARHIWSAYSRSMMPEYDHKVILEFLRLLGGHQVKVTLHQFKTSRGVWAIPLERISEAEEARSIADNGDNIST
jgi:hypothetical protein